MQKTTQVALALGFVGAMAIGTSLPAKAQIITFGGPGVGVELILRPDNHRYPRYNRYYHGQPYAYQYYRGPKGYGPWQQCGPGWSLQDGVCKPYRGY